MTDSLWDQGQAAIAARRALVEAGTGGELRTICPTPWGDRVLINDSGEFYLGVSAYTAVPTEGWSESARERAGNLGKRKAADAALIVAAVNAFAADTDALAAVLDRHRPVAMNLRNDYLICRPCAHRWPCPVARAALTALGVGEG